MLVAEAMSLPKRAFAAIIPVAPPNPSESAPADVL